MWGSEPKWSTGTRCYDQVRFFEDREMLTFRLDVSGVVGIYREPGGDIVVSIKNGEVLRYSGLPYVLIIDPPAHDGNR